MKKKNNENNYVFKENIKLSGVSKLQYVALIISITSILLTCVNLYFQYVRELHSVKVTVSADLDNWASGKSKLIVKGVIANFGNRTEVVNSGEIIIGNDSDKSRFYLSKIDPIVLKSGDAIPFSLFSDFSNVIKYSGDRSKDEDSIYIHTNIKFLTTSVDGASCIKIINLGTFCYYEPSDNFTFNKDSADIENWIELIR